MAVLFLMIIAVASNLLFPVALTLMAVKFCKNKDVKRLAIVVWINIILITWLSKFIPRFHATQAAAGFPVMPLVLVMVVGGIVTAITELLVEKRKVRHIVLFFWAYALLFLGVATFVDEFPIVTAALLVLLPEIIGYNIYIRKS